LLYYFPGQAAALQASYDAAIAAIPDCQSKASGIAVGQIAAARIIAASTERPTNPPCNQLHAILKDWSQV
jgi:hypothetical protein